MSKNTIYILIFLQALIATLGSLYYGRFGDPMLNREINEFRNPNNAFIPCNLCWFARIFMYPIVILCIVGCYKKISQTWNILALSFCGILLEMYQYWYWLEHTSEQVKSFVCGISTGKSCAATDVVYGGFITIPFLCLTAFVVIFVLAVILAKRENKQKD